MKKISISLDAYRRKKNYVLTVKLWKQEELAIVELRFSAETAEESIPFYVPTV